MCAVMMVFTLSASAFAAQEEEKINYIYANSEEEVDWDSLTSYDVVLIPNENLPQEETGDVPQIQPRGTYPPTKVWNVVNEGTYSFQGNKSNNNCLYSEYNITGASAYDYKVTNSYYTEITLKFIKGTTTYRTATIPGHMTYYGRFDNNVASPSINSSTKFYMTFDGSPEIHFSGTIWGR